MTSAARLIYLVDTFIACSDPQETSVQYFAPRTERDAIDLRARFGAGVRPLAGGTDLLVSLRRGVRPAAILSLRHLGWNRITREGATIVLGSTTTAAAIAREMGGALPLLAEAASWLGGPQVRNRATIGGNLANGSPAADLALCLVVLEAEVELVSVRGHRRLPVSEFMRGPKVTALADDELLRTVRVPVPDPASRPWFGKLGPRSRHFISRVAVAALLTPCADGTNVRIGLGAVAPTPIRARGAERFASGQSRWGRREIEEAARLAAEECSPIDDWRASASYRRDLVRALVARFLREVTA